MARKNNTFLYVIVGILALAAIYCIWNATSKKSKDKVAESFAQTQDMNESDIQIVQQADEALDDDYQLLETPEDSAAFQVGFGMGPGLYGSGRHTSEMIGN